MPLNEKDALEFAKYAQVDDSENLEAAITKFNGTYYTDATVQSNKELMNKVTGKMMGEATKHMVADVRDVLGDELNGNDLFRMPIAQAISTVTGLLKTKIQNQKTEFEKLSGQNNDQALKEWQDKYQKLEGKYKEVETLKNNVATEFESFKTTAQKKEQETVINYFKTDLLSKIQPKFDKTLPPLAIKGFQAEMEADLKWITDEEGKPYLADKDGKRFQSKKKAGEFMTNEEAFESYAESKGVLQKNPQGGKPAFGLPIGQPAKPVTMPLSGTFSADQAPVTRKVSRRAQGG